MLSASNGDYLKNLGFTAGIEENLRWGEMVDFWGETFGDVVTYVAKHLTALLKVDNIASCRAKPA